MTNLEFWAAIITAIIGVLFPILFKNVRSQLVRPFAYVWESLKLPHKHGKLIDGIASTLVRLESKTDTLVHQVTTNGGTSLFDAVNMLLLQSFIESQSRRKLMAAYGFAFWESDKNGLCVYASPALAEIIGLPQEDVIGDGWMTNLKPDHKDEVIEAWSVAVEKKIRFVYDYTFVHYDGSEVDVQGMSFPIVHRGNVEGFVGVLTPKSGNHFPPKSN